MNTGSPIWPLLGHKQTLQIACMISLTELDELSRATLEASGRTAPSRDSFALAFDLGLVPKPRTRIGAALVDDRAIEFDGSEAPGARQRLVAREVARWALRQWRLEELDAYVAYVTLRVWSAEARLLGPCKACGRSAERDQPLRLAFSESGLAVRP